jgi:tellurite resistance protein
MEVILALAIIAFLVWVIIQSRRQTPSSPPTSEGQTRRAAPVTREPPATAVPSVNADDCWIPPGRETAVAGYTLTGGMLYVGSGLRSVAGLRVEPALIDPSLPVKRSNPDRSGTGMTYWPSYSSIPPECRSAYLEWLASGRRDPSACIGYVFLFLYGLERRVLADARHSDGAKRELPLIAKEVRELLQVYADNRSFRRYATQLLDFVNAMTTDGRESVAPTDLSNNELAASLRVGLGRLAAAGKPLPPDWALSWFLVDRETSVATAIRRCFREFGGLFRARYVREHGDGLLLTPKRSQLQMTVTPASATFGGPVQVSMNVPDVSDLTAPLSQLRKIGMSCASDLDAFSRWVGRNPDSPRTLAAVALLPPELVRTNDSDEAGDLWKWVESTMATGDRAVVKTDALLYHCPSFGAGKLSKSEAVLLAQLIEKGGFGIEPDVRFGGTPLAPGTTAVLFKLAPGSPTIASPSYVAATILLHLAVAVSAADGSISRSEEEHLKQHIERGLALSDGERLRLAAHLAWLITSPPSLSGLKKRLEPLDTRQRAAIADFIIGVAGADGQISPDEIKTLGKVYPMLGLDADAVYSHVHAMTAGVATELAEPRPTTIVPAQGTTDFRIPSRPEPTKGVRLDMTAVNAKLAESAQIATILEDIFTDDEIVDVRPPAPTTSTAGKLPAAHAALLSRLVARSEWSRSDFEVTAAELGLMPDAAIDHLNEAAFEHAGAPVLEGDDPMQVDRTIAKELIT